MRYLVVWWVVTDVAERRRITVSKETSTIDGSNCSIYLIFISDIKDEDICQYNSRTFSAIIGESGLAFASAASSSSETGQIGEG